MNPRTTSSAVGDDAGDRDTRSALIRVGAVLGIAGSGGAAVGNILHPDVPDDPVAAAQVIADSGIWVPAHLVIAVTVFLMVFGLLAVTLTLEGGQPRAWSVLGLMAGLAGVTIGVLLMAADGITAKYAAVAWAESAEAEQAAALQIASFAERTSFGLVAMFNVVFGGLTFLFYGIAVVFSSRFPRWMGGAIAAVGAVSIVIGAIQGLTGTSSPTIELLTVISPTLFTLWTITICTLILRNRPPSPA